MSLFDKLNNKRYNLEEEKKGNTFASGSFDPANQEKKFVKNERTKRLSKSSNVNVNKKQITPREIVKKLDTRDKKIQTLDKKIIKPTVGDAEKTNKLIDRIITSPKKGEIEKAEKVVNKFTAKSLADKAKADVFGDPDFKKTSYDTKGGYDVKGGKDAPGSSTIVNQNKPKKLANLTTGSKVQKSVDAKVITKKFNQSNPNRPEYVKPTEFKAAETKTKLVNPKQERPLGTLVKRTKKSSTAISGKLTPGQIDFSKAGELAAKRKARIDPKTGKATQAGVFDFAKNRGGFNRMSQGMSKSDFKKMITSDPKKASQFKSIVTKATKIASDPKSKEYRDIAQKINTSDYAGRIAKKDPKIAKMTSSQKAANLARVKAAIDAKPENLTQPSITGKGRVPLKGTVLAVDPTSKSGFKRVRKATTKGQEILSKQISTKDLTTPTPPKLEPLEKPKGNLFSRIKTRIKNFGKGVRNYLQEPGRQGYRTYTRPDGTVVTTRNKYPKNFFKRTFQKLPRRGKLGALIGAGIIGTSIVSSLLPKKEKGAGAKIPFDPKNYKPATIKLSLTSGKKDKKGNIVKPPELPVNNNPNVKNLVNRTAQAKKNYKIPKVT